MNPFKNRWLALLVIVGFLFVVAELVGTDDRGGVLSQVAQSQSGDVSGEGTGNAPPPEVISQPSVVEDVPEDVPEEDQPQVVTEDDVDDTADFAALDDVPESAIVEDMPVEDTPVEDTPIEGDSGEE